MAWFIICLVSFYDSDYISIISFFSEGYSKILFSVFLIFAYFFSALTISEIFEDYIHVEKIKNVANKTLFLFAIIIPLLTIISIINFNTWVHIKL